MGADKNCAVLLEKLRWLPTTIIQTVVFFKAQHFYPLFASRPADRKNFHYAFHMKTIMLNQNQRRLSLAFYIFFPNCF